MKPKLLSGIGALFVALLIAGAAFVLAVGADAVLSANTAQETLRNAPNSSGMSEEEFMAYAERMEQKYGPEAVSALRLHIPDETRGPSQGAGATPNIRYVSAWSGSLEIRNNDGVVLADSDNALVLYALDLTDEQGRDHYYWWQWGAAKIPHQTCYGTPPTGICLVLKIQLHYGLASSFRVLIATTSARTLSSTRARSGRSQVNARWETPGSSRLSGLVIMKGLSLSMVSAKRDGRTERVRRSYGRIA
jgi:hypothetical protein